MIRGVLCGHVLCDINLCVFLWPLQPTDAPKPLKPWGFRPAVEVVQPVVQSPQVVFIQPVLSHPTLPSHKDLSSRHRRPKKYLPLLKSYPKIAPHPGDGGSGSLGSGGTASSSSSASSMSSSSSSSTRPKRGAGHREHSHRGKRHHQKKKSQSGGHSSPPIPPASPSALSLKPLPSRLAPVTTVPLTPEPTPSPPVTPTTLQTPPPPPPVTVTTLQQKQTLTCCGQEPLGPGSDPDPETETKRMRFCNTYNILSESGLLGITLKTKELLRQNRRTQGDLDRLKEHTELFVQALLSSDPGVLLKLQTRLQEEEEEEEEDAERGGDTRERDAAKDD